MFEALIIICVLYSIWLLTLLPIKSDNKEQYNIKWMIFYLNAPFPFHNEQKATKCLQECCTLKLKRILSEGNY